MIAVTSPAKTLDESSWDKAKYPATQPVFLEEADRLVNVIAKLDQTELASFLDVSDNLSVLNFERFQNWDDAKAKPAVLLYDGDIFRQFEPESFTESQQVYAQKHVFILSGLYGILRAYDWIHPYRLEMKTKLTPLAKVAGFHLTDRLADFWLHKLTNFLEQQLQTLNDGAKYIVNLASNEYLQAIDRKSFKDNWLDIEFRQIKNGEFKNYGIYAKKARGQFIRFMIEQQVDDLSSLKQFDYDGYGYNQSGSTKNSLQFVKENI